jgi:hypothetical protein
MDEFWRYVAQHITDIQFPEVDKSLYGAIFNGNLSTTIIESIEKKIQDLDLNIDLLFYPNIFYCVKYDKLFIRYFLVISNKNDKRLNPQVENLYSSRIKLPEPWIVVKYQPQTICALTGKFVVAGGALLHNNAEFEEQFSEVIGEYAAATLPHKYVEDLDSYAGTGDLTSINTYYNDMLQCRTCLLCNLPEYNCDLINGHCEYCDVICSSTE